MRRIPWGLTPCLALLLLSPPAVSQPSTEPSPSEVTPEVAAIEPPLTALPVPPDVRLPEPTREDELLLEQLLQRLIAPDGARPAGGLESLLDVDPSLLPAVLSRLNREAQGANRAAMKQLLLDTRRAARDATRPGKDNEESSTIDYLPMMLAHPKPNDEHWKRLVTVLALSRICTQLGTVEAVRVLIHVFVRFEFLRIDTQLQLEKLGDRSLAALIEATQHPAPMVSQWAKRRLDFLGKAIPSEVVQVDDPAVLADVLRAYGRTRDPDSGRLVLSFANSERAQVREAARQTVSLFRETAEWPLRDTYENMVGRKAPREWPWDRVARELFREFDRMRLAELYEHYGRGITALEKSDWDAMRQAFDKVVARSPNFEPRDRLVEGYSKFADAKLDTHPVDAEQSLQRVLRLTESDAVRRSVESLLLTLQAKRLSEHHVADRALLQRALELDPDNGRARALLDELGREPFEESSTFLRWLWPLLLGGAALLFAAVVAFGKWRTARAVRQPVE